MKKLSLYVFLVLLMVSACSDQNQLSCIEGDCTNGYGTYTYASGNKYVGEFKEGKRNGQGTATFANGTVEKGIWENGELVEPN